MTASPPPRAPRPRPLASGIAALLLATVSGPAQTYTAPGSGTFTDLRVWNFGVGPIPASDATLALMMQSFGGTLTAANDLNLTLQSLDLAGNGTLVMSSLLGGDFAFTGAGLVNFGSNATVTLSAGVVLGSALSGLTLDGAGPGSLAISGIISSNTSAGAPLTIATDAANAGTGVVTLSAANTFTGGVVLNSGTLSLGNNRALGERTNVLTINGGSVRTSATVSVANNFTLNSTLNLNGSAVLANPATLALSGVLSGTGGVTQSGSGLGAVLQLRSINTYTGATTVRALDHAEAAADEGASIKLAGAAASILMTSSIDVGAGGTFRLDYSDGHSASNARVSAATGIGVTGGFLETFGNDGLVTQSVGTVNAGGLTTIAAVAPGATQLTIANLQRAAGGAVTFTGPNLGNAAVGPGVTGQGNVVLTQLNGGAPSSALVGGSGGTATSNISILPWALGDTVNAGNSYDAGSGFVTYGPHGVRLLDASSEYNTTNNFTTLGDAFQNMRIGGSVTDPAAPVTVNSIFIETLGVAIGGANAITITSGALASNVLNHTISAPVNFGTGGAGEAIVSVVGTLNTPNTVTLSGQLTAGSLVKSGHGTLELSGTGNVITGAITIDAGDVSVGAVSQLGGATSLTFHSPSQNAAGAGLTYTGAGADTLSAPVVTSDGAAGFTVTSASLNLTGNVSGAGGLRKDGDGTLTLSGTNTYSGGTFLGGGTLQFDSDARLGAAGGFLNTNGGALSLGAGWTSARALHVETLSTLRLLKNGFNATLSGAITGGGGLHALGAGTLAVTGGDNGYAGTIQIGDDVQEGGTVALVGAGAMNSASITFGSAVAGAVGAYVFDLSAATAAVGTPWRSIAALTTTGGFTQPHSVQLGASIGAPVDLRVSGGTGAFGQGSVTGTGILTGFGKLIKVGGGTLTLANANTAANSTFLGGVEIWGGTLSFGVDGQLGNSTNGIAIQGGILNTAASATTARAITLAAPPQPLIRAAAAVTLANGLSAAGGAVHTINGAIGGAGGFNKAGTGTVLLGAANNYAGDTQITAGILAFTDNIQLGSASSRIRLGNGTAMLRLAAAPVSATTYPLPRTIFVLGGTTTINAENVNATLNLSGELMSSGSVLQLSGPGSFLISGDNRSLFTTLRISIDAGPATPATLASTGQLRRAVIRVEGSGSNFSIGGLTRELGGIEFIGGGNTFTLGSGGRLTVGFNNTALDWQGSISGAGASSFTKVGTGTIGITSNSNTFTGGFHLLSGTGTTTLSANGSLPAQSAFTIGAWGNNANRGPTFTLSNTVTDSSTRLADTQAIHSNAGEIVFTTNAGTPSTETAASLRGAGMTTMTMSTGGSLNFTDATNGLTRLNGGTFLFRAGNANMGTAVATTAIANLTFANLPGAQLIGGAGAAGTTTISIVPYAIGGITAPSLGTNFVTYSANGIRVLNTGTEVQPSLTGAAANENVRLNITSLTTTTISGADKTVNALNLTGTANTSRIVSAAAEKLILGSGLLLNSIANVYTASPGTAGVPLGLHVAELQTGAGNTRELNVFTTGGDLLIGSPITTTGGLTKSGAAALYLTSTASTYTGATTVNAGNLVIDSLAALGGSTQLRLGGGFLKYRGTDATLTQSVLAAGGSATNAGASAGFDVVSGTTLTVPAGSVAGFGGILKDGAGVLRLTGTNTQSGATIISGGALAIDNPAALGTNPRVVFADGNISGLGGQTLRFDAPMTLTQDFIVNSAGNGVGLGFDTNGNDVTLSGTLLDARSTSVRGLYKFGAGELNLTATEMFTGPTQIYGGTVRLSGANGSLVNSTGTGGFRAEGSILVHPGAALVLDNSTGANSNRLPDVWDTPFGTGNAANGAIVLNGGELKLIGGSTNIVERTNQISFASATVTLSAGSGSIGLTSGQVIRGSTSGSSAMLIRGTNLGSTPGPGNANWFVHDLGSGGVQLHGAGGAEGTPYINILRGGMADTSATGTGTDLVTYAADVGFRALTSGEYTSTIPANNFDLNRAPNIALTGAATVNETTAISALKLGGGGSILQGSGTVILAQSTVLATANGTIGVSSFSTNITNGGPSTIFLTAGPATTLTVNSVLPGTAMGKYGEGTLVLNGRRIGSGPVALKQGTLALGAGGSIGPLTAMGIDPGATFDLGGSDRVIGSLLQDGGTIGTTNLGQGNGGTVALGANTLTLYDGTNSTFTGSATGAGGFIKALASTGTSTFTQPLAYTGPTIGRGGNILLTGAGTLATSSIELRGGNLQMVNTDDNAGAGGTIALRIGASTPIVLAGGGLSITENANAPGAHQFGSITLAGRGSLSISPGATAPSASTIANLIRAPGAGGTITIAAPNLGLAPSPIGGVRIFANQINGAAAAAALIGGGSGVGAATQSILPWAWGATTGSFLTAGAHGLRPLATSEYESALNAPSTATANLRTTAAQTLTAPRTVNALLVTAGNVTGAFDLTLESGALATTGATSIGAGGNILLTGAGNTREAILNIGAATTLHYHLTTSGGVTKFGSAALTLTGANSFTGGLTINEGSVLFASDARLGASGGAIRFGGATAGGPSLTYSGIGTLPFTRPIETTGFGTLTGVASERWQLQQPITGAGGIGYAGSNAVFELNAANSYTGPTNWTGGHLYFTGDSGLGNGGELLLNSGTAQDLVLRSDWTSSRLIHAAAASALQTDGHSATWSGQFIGTAAFTKNGTGSLILTEAMPYSGVLTVAAGAVVLKDRGSLAANASSHVVRAGAALTLDDTAAHFSDRLHDSSGTITLNGGALSVLGSSTATTEEVFNNFALGAGAATITLPTGSGEAIIVRLAGTVANAATAASLWRGTNLGVNAPGTANSANLLLTPVNTSAFPLTGGGAPAGHPSISIIRGGFGDTSATGSGTQFVTYDLVKGVRLLDEATEFITTWLDGSNVTDNLKADGATFTVANPSTANSLWLKNGGSVTGAGQVTLSSGNLLVTGSSNSIANPFTTGANALAVGGPGDVTLTGVFTGSGGLIKTGAGTLTLNVANFYTGNTVLAAGIFAVGDAGAFDTTTLQIQGGEIRNVTGSPLTLANDVVLNGPWKIGGAQNFEFSGTVTLNNATREIHTSNTGTTTISGEVTNSQSLINYGLTKTGAGLLVLSNAANTYDGPTKISAGVLSVGALADGSVGTSLNPSGIGQSYSDADQLVLDGGALRYTGPLVNTDRLFTLTQNGGTIDASGTGNLTFSNTGTIAAPGAGPRTLTLTGNNTTTNTMAVSITNGPTLSDATSLTVSTTQWTLTNANPFTGPTLVSSGTLETAAPGALGATASVTVNTGGTLLLSSLANQVNDNAAVTLAGGKVRGNADGLDENVGTLTLSASSVIDFGNFASGFILRFDDSSSLTWSGLTLSVWNWSPGLDRLYIGVNPSGLLASQLSKISFYSDSGSTLFNGMTGAAYNTYSPYDGTFGEVSPIPEPSSVGIATALLGLIGWRERRREQARRRAERAEQRRDAAAT